MSDTKCSDIYIHTKSFSIVNMITEKSLKSLCTNFLYSCDPRVFSKYSYFRILISEDGIQIAEIGQMKRSLCEAESAEKWEFTIRARRCARCESALSRERNGDLFVCQEDSVFSSGRILFVSRMCAHAEYLWTWKTTGDFSFNIAENIKVFAMGKCHFPRNFLARSASNRMSLRIVA